ncbi:tyrosine-protein phosphatase [Paenibacillus sp. HWE-109]|uniref:tyrosine-protein phosphatase n=1 Tax=Paenibacillus sp. HWE-109 TaxID=1306526 RepID=UPI001EDD469C|nr:tyrosine-protein phosphatase [Paenibacillus sp. HWE-109]UKS23877.1 tyrosine-protein phosphatase [Paenibacillus sp. HWE-109]
MSTTRDGAYPGQRIIVLEGTHNFRDMGGYQTADGRKVKYGIFFRSDELTGLTEQDLAAVQALNIKTIFDYRNDYEAQKKPDPVFASVKNIRIAAIQADQASRINMSGDVGDGDRNQRDIADMIKSGYFKQYRADTMMMEVYTKLPLGNPSYKRLMELIQHSDNLGLLHHCTAGKDRTGVGAALILLALGVPEETVMEDYLLTNETMKGFNRKLLSQLAEHVDEVELRNIEHLFGVREQFMEAAFGSIKKTYGNVDTYFSEEFGLTDQRREALQSMFLE